ncbi:hypothetical protein BGW36DRAFT_421940 [Talaromyces proteolyticus]|uniref:tyrosinase n=1 Tax=Talaromyces proteolyticus TaxID=1131652 RepID=A0AAD4L0L4_9EURO|nr:uncharacterized protein BGW36DRAFT_421940 [Talaromyces proteolyticus]KAH8705378.1 hypothetical protein BGW36DRAFT_421940 [Talaromyces proteolyticus]
MASSKIDVSLNPTWDNNVAALFSRPFWTAIDSDPEAVGRHWISEMRDYSPPYPRHLYLDLSSSDSVQANVVTIYQHLRSRSMPITKNSNHYWPEEALETLRLWANQGFRRSATDPIRYREVIPEAQNSEINFRTRKDISNLTPSELQMYREKLDDVLLVGQLESKWQELGLLHAEWCLHYQEAFIFWHRAYLKYVEELIDFAVPYWNGFAAESGDPSSPHAGIPSAFLDETYIHSNGERRKNPLKYALSLGGENKSRTSKYVERCQELVDGRTNPLWAKKVSMLALYHQQIANAFSQEDFSLREGHGYPWGNVPDFSENQPDSLYPEAARQYFDGLFEQVHDNYHGWIGRDMADNSYTAFDPIFLSYHANMDRIAEMYLRSGYSRQFSSNFPLRPFVDNASSLSYDEPCEYRYTTLGDMAKPTQAMRYLYAPPAAPDFLSITQVEKKSASVPSGGTSVVLTADEWKARLKSAIPQTETDYRRYTPYVVFSGISCLKETYQIDVFVLGAGSCDPDVATNLDYIGQVTRLGMGNGRGEETGIRNPHRCEKKPITRILNAGHVAERLRRKPEIQQVVTEVSTGRHIEDREWQKLPGFEGHLIWLKKDENNKIFFDFLMGLENENIPRLQAGPRAIQFQYPAVDVNCRLKNIDTSFKDVSSFFFTNSN